MIEELNTAVFRYINNFAGKSEILDIFAIAVAEYLVFVFVLWLVYLWFEGGKKHKNIVLYSVYSAILGLSLNFLISLFYFHPRPFMVPIGKMLIHHIPETSFPSGHTTFTLSIALMLVYFRKTRKSGLVLSALGFVVGLARVFCGVHFPLDIVGSAAVALVSSFLIYSLRSQLTPLNQLVINLYLGLVKKGTYEANKTVSE